MTIGGNTNGQIDSSGRKAKLPEPAIVHPRGDIGQLAQTAREARVLSQIDACKTLEKQAFRMAELAREANLGFLIYLFEMARVASVDERARLSRL